MARKSSKLRRRRNSRKSKRGGRSLKRKTLHKRSKRSKRSKRKTRKGGKAKQKNIATRNAEIDKMLNVALQDLQKHVSPTKPGVIYDAFRLEGKIRHYPMTPPVIKGMFGTNKKKTMQAKEMWNKGLQNQKQKLEQLFNSVFEGEKAYKEFKNKFSMAAKPSRETIGSPELTDSILRSLDQTYKRLGIQNNLVNQVMQFRNM